MKHHHEAPIYYCDGIVNPTEFDGCEKVIAQLLGAEHRSAGLEQLDHYDIYSVRVDGKGRLLFATVMVAGRHYILLLRLLT